MIKVIDYRPNLTNKTVCVLFADTKEEVSGILTIEGLPQGVEPDTGSILLTASGDIAFLTSSDGWNFIGEDDTQAASSPALSLGNISRPDIQLDTPDVIGSDDA